MHAKNACRSVVTKDCHLPLSAESCSGGSKVLLNTQILEGPFQIGCIAADYCKQALIQYLLTSKFALSEYDFILFVLL